MEQSFYICEHCGSVVTFMTNKGVPVMCCGQGMKALIPGTTDASAEKHVPVVSAEGDKVTVAVGSAAHPMAQEHYIEWIMLETKQGVQLKRLKPAANQGRTLWYAAATKPSPPTPTAIFTAYGNLTRRTDKMKYVCDVCGWVYDEELGVPDDGIAPGTKFEDLPDDFACPLCGVGKEQFSKAD